MTSSEPVAQVVADLITATVLPDVTGLDKTFDYLVPAALAGRAVLGARVRVPLHGRRVGGWIIRLGPPSGGVAVDRLVSIVAVSSLGPDASLIDLAGWAALRWGVGRLRPFMVTASPPTNVVAVGTPRRRRPVTAGGETRLAGGAKRLFDDGGGTLRVTPADDLVMVVAEAAERGPLLVVHPAVATVHCIAASLRGRGWTVAVLPEEWASAAAGVDVVIGGRAAAWGPAPGVTGFLVLDEHDESLQEERTPTWNARDVMIERARRSGQPCVLVSPCPTVTALAWSGRRWMRPRLVDEREGWPTVEIVDRTDEEPWRRSLLGSSVLAAVRDHGKRVVCVHNAPGRARLLACRSCRSLLVCERCSAAVRQRDDSTLYCERCALARPPVCQHCGSSALANVRPGISRLREELEAAANRPVVAITGQSIEELPDVDVFVGTEAVLHRVREADVVAFVDIDAELLAPRYRCAEQAFALLVRAARILGPRSRGGRLIVQTHLPDHEVLLAARHTDPGRLARVEAARRRNLGLPPFAALAVVSGPGATDLVAATGLTSAVAGDSILVRADDWMTLGTALARAPRTKGQRVRIDVDPIRR